MRGLPDITWRDIPAAPFVMGSPDDSLSFPGTKETPQHIVDLPAFRISRYPITNAQYAAFTADKGYARPEFWVEAAANGYWQAGRVKRSTYREGKFIDEWATAPADYGRPFNLPNHPVVGVSWYEAVAFCHWLTFRLQSGGHLPPGQVVSLPSERQWEKAARGGVGATLVVAPGEVGATLVVAPDEGSGEVGATLAVAPGGAGARPAPTADLTGLGDLSGLSRLYPWGHTSDPDRANYADTGLGSTSAVGCFPGGASPYGVEEMAGNVWEWCRTKWQEDYNDYRDDNDLREYAARVVRGGGWDDSVEGVRCAVRSWSHPRYMDYGRGFRVVLAAPL